MEQDANKATEKRLKDTGGDQKDDVGSFHGSWSNHDRSFCCRELLYAF